MMTDAEMASLLRGGTAVLALDTNVITCPRKDGRLSFNPFLDICDLVDRIGSTPTGPRIRVVVPASVHFEVLHDLRLSKGSSFNLELVRNPLKSKGVDVLAFDEESAELASGELAQWCADSEVWRQRKKQHCLSALGLADAPGHGLATIDWLLATEAEARGWLLVTDDQGPEFADVDRKVKRTRLAGLLIELARSIPIPDSSHLP
jgi:hypothetical protein